MALFTGKTRRRRQEIHTLLGAETRITGDVAFRGGLHVDGTVIGNVSAEGVGESVVSISEGGVVEGTVVAGEVVVNGTVKGDVVARERVELGATARVVGNVVYGLIEMAMGAQVNGKLIHERPPASPTGAAGDAGELADGAPEAAKR